MGVFSDLFNKIFEVIGLFQFWRVIPIHKVGVKLTWGKNPVVMQPGFHWVWPFEINHVKAVVVKSEWVSTTVVHLTTKDLKTISAAPVIKYKIVNAIKWFYNANDAATNLHDITRFCMSDVLTEEEWLACTKRPVWTKIKNKIKDKTAEELGIEVEDFGLIDLTLSRVIITQI